jgi:hypothetical protein
MFPFEAGCTHILSGQSGSGKTQFIYKLLRNAQTMFGDQPPQVIRYYYGIWQPTFDRMKAEIPNISFHEGIPTEEELLEFTKPGVHTLICLDDVMHIASNSSVVELIFTRLSHHRTLTCLYIQQNAYVKGKNQVTISMNAKYLEIFRSPRSLLQLQYLNSQIFPKTKSFLTDAYKDVMSEEQYGYLVIDLTAHCSDELRVRTRVFQGEQTIVYKPE